MQKIAIAGYGTVGGGVAEILRRNAAKIAESAGEPVELKYILVRRDFPGDPFEKEMVRDFSVIESDPEVTILVETIGGCGAALEYCMRALKAGKSVVTANKQLVAEHGAALMELAREYGAGFLFEASVAGGIPVLHPLSRCLGANVLEEVSGILNGTTNYILTQMLENGQSYDAALREAQRLGYAEADPAADVEGLDAGRKICILAGLAFGKNVAPDRISVEGITKITALDAAFAAAGGMKLRLLGRAVQSENGLFVFVSPHFVPGTQLLAGIGGVNNAVEICGSEVGRVQFAGPGAGRYPTASAVLGDVIELAGNPGRQRCAWSAEPARLAPLEDFKARWFVRTRNGAALWRKDSARCAGSRRRWAGRAALRKSSRAVRFRKADCGSRRFSRSGNYDPGGILWH